MSATTPDHRNLYLVTFVPLIGALVLLAAFCVLIRHFGQPFSSAAIFLYSMALCSTVITFAACAWVVKTRRWKFGIWLNVVMTMLLLFMSAALVAFQWLMLINTI